MIRYDVFFDSKYGFYRARFWGDGVDTQRKVPDSFWASLGHRVPASHDQKFYKLALSWAAVQLQPLKEKFGPKPAKRPKKTFFACWELYKKQNPDLVVEATIARGENCSRNFATFLDSLGFGAITPEEIDIALATRYRNWRTGVSNRTIWNELTWAKQVCTFALAWQSETGCEALRLIKLPYIELPEKGGLALTEAEFGRIIERARSRRDKQILVVGVSTRLRRRNLLSLRGEFFDRERRWLRIARDTMKGGRRKVRRDLSIPVADWTLEYVAKDSGLLWPNANTGEPLQWVEHIVRQLAHDAAVPDFSLHDLRTTGNSWLDAAGVDKLTQRHLLGHAEPQDVTDIYRRKFEGELREAVAVFDSIRQRNGW